MKYLILIYIIFLNSTALLSQNIVVKVIDENSKAPISYAAIKVDEFHGSISNEEGFFTLNTENVDVVTISCLGYKTKTLSINDIKANNNIISLEEAINELNSAPTEQIQQDHCHTSELSEWAILGSNQWPLPCEGTRHSRENPVFAGISRSDGRSGLTASDHQ